MACVAKGRTIPKWPLTANVWRGLVSVATPPALTVQCQLHMSAPDPGSVTAVGGGSPALTPSLYSPKGTDIRGKDLNPSPDTVEVPAGSKRYYQVLATEDVAKGFQNEFRLSVLLKFLAPPGAVGPWPNPMP